MRDQTPTPYGETAYQQAQETQRKYWRWTEGRVGNQPCTDTELRYATWLIDTIDKVRSLPSETATPTIEIEEGVFVPRKAAGHPLPHVSQQSDKSGEEEEVDIVKRLHSTTDASVWAHEFNKAFAQMHEGCELDEGWLIGWFANAIEIGRDAGKAQSSAIGLREFAERCRPAARVWADRAERAALNDLLPPHYKPVLVAEAERARKLLDEIDSIISAADRGAGDAG